MFRNGSLIVKTLVSLFFIVGSLHAQTTTATISGTATDESGGVLAGAAITVTNRDTGLRRSTTTQDNGRYVVAQLPPGPYEMSATMTGFETTVRSGITLAIGQEATVAMRMRVGAVSERVTVVGEAPLVDTSSSAVSGVVEQKRIVELPLNGRDFTQLALIEPGIVAVRNTDQVATKGFGVRVAAAGSRADQTAWLLDGTNIKSMANFGTPGSSSGLLLGVDAIREFQVLTSNYSAEYGGNSGGVVNMVTKSGKNEINGTVYAFHRNDNLDARNFFDIPNKPEFKRNQFGFSVGGPIKKDKAFFFGNYEGMRQRLGLISLAIVPDENAHRGLLPNAQGVLTQIQVAPVVRPFLDTYPLPNGKLGLGPNGLPNGTAELFIPGSDKTNQDYFMGRLDYVLSEKATLFGRIVFDDTEKSRPDAIPLTDGVIPTQTGYYTIQYDRIVNSKFLSNSRLAFNRTVLNSDVALNVEFPAGTFIFNQTVPSQVGFTGGTELGPTDRNIFGNVQNLWQLSQSFIYTPGNHSMKFGGNLEAYWFHNFGGGGDTGDFNWPTMSSFIQDIGPLNAFAVSVPGSSTHRSFRQNVIGLYLQDDWKWRPNLTLNLGVRYEPFTTPREKWGRVSVIKDWVNATHYDVGVPFWNNPSKKNISPRVGFAWDPGSDGKTAVRGGFGLFFVDTLNFYYRSMSQKNPPFAGNIEEPLGTQRNMASTIAAVRGIGSSILTSQMNPASLIEVIEYNLNPTYEIKFNLTVERELPGDMSVSLGYLGGRGVHLWRSSVANASYSTIREDGREFVAAGSPRPNLNAGLGDARNADAQSFYNGLQFQVKKRLNRGFQLQSSYSWSKTIDDSSTATANTDYQEGASSRPHNTKADRGLSAIHVGHNWVLNGLWAIPFPKDHGVVSGVLGGWNLSGIFSASSGTPFLVTLNGRRAPDQGRASVQRPDFAVGRSIQSLIREGNLDQYFDPSGFILPPVGTYGIVGRNVLLGPGFASFDSSLRKDIPVGLKEGSRLEFRADFFNLLNRANFAIPSVRQAISGATGAPVDNAGKITRTVSTSRQMQFGLKFSF
ncbi:MAG: TonB-dependent receptor [Acidobacteria bacterium]|nr:TonB-dependent receptor [Acidobacteriota bacterium]